jgi:ABC-2 type transport system ATP-binding protein
MAALIATGLRKRYDRIAALDGVDLTVEAGEVRGLLGPNGAGKTTLLRVILGLVGADAGSVLLLGDQASPERSVPAGVAGFVEEPSFYPYLSGRANLEVLAELDEDGAGQRIDEALSLVELTGRAQDRVGGYSSGMRQRLGIAAALLRAPRLLLLDEPTTGLDPAGIRDVGRLLRRLSGEGVAVLLSSHQIAEVQDLCDSYTVLSGGRVVWEGTAAQMRAQAPASSFRLRTSNDNAALALAAERPDLAEVQAHAEQSGGLTVSGDQDSLDAFVVALGRAGVAVRSLELAADPLEAMFFALTAEAQANVGFGESRVR